MILTAFNLVLAKSTSYTTIELQQRAHSPQSTGGGRGMRSLCSSISIKPMKKIGIMLLFSLVLFILNILWVNVSYKL
jgi:hypothetical protein